MTNTRYTGMQVAGTTASLIPCVPGFAARGIAVAIGGAILLTVGMPVVIADEPAPGPDEPAQVAPAVALTPQAAESSDEDVEPPPPPPPRPGVLDRLPRPENRQPILLKAVPTEYPDEYAGTGVNAEVMVSLLVDRLGRASHVRVESSPDEAFTDAALDALSKFEFLPALKNGKVSNAPLQMTLLVREELGDRTFFDYEGGKIALVSTRYAGETDSPVRRMFGLRPIYPFEMLADGKPGEVVLDFFVGEDGEPRQIKIVSSTHKEFSLAAEGAVVHWRYSPALKMNRPVTAAMRYRISFEAGEVKEEIRALAKRILEGGPTSLVPLEKVDSQPRVLSRIEPVAPPDEDGRGRHTRRATVSFIVTDRGTVELPRIVSSSDPLSGYIAMVALSYWRFEPARNSDTPVPVVLSMPFRF